MFVERRKEFKRLCNVELVFEEEIYLLNENILCMHIWDTNIPLIFKDNVFCLYQRNANLKHLSLLFLLFLNYLLNFKTVLQTPQT